MVLASLPCSELTDYHSGSPLLNRLWAKAGQKHGGHVLEQIIWLRECGGA